MDGIQTTQIYVEKPEFGCIKEGILPANDMLPKYSYALSSHELLPESH